MDCVFGIVSKKSLSWPWSSRFSSMLYTGSFIVLHLTFAAAAAKLRQSCLTLCDPIDGSPPGSSVPGVLQARRLEWVAIFFLNAWKWKVKVKSESEVTQSCPTLSNTMDCSLRGSSIHGISQASTGVGCHHLLCILHLGIYKFLQCVELCWFCYCIPRLALFLKHIWYSIKSFWLKRSSVHMYVWMSLCVYTYI